MTTARKAASRASRTVGPEARISRSSSGPRRHEASRPASRASGKTPHPARAVQVTEKPRVNLHYQAVIKSFETGLRAFQQRDYAGAAEIFEKLVQSDARDVAERAHVHLRLCRQRTARPAPLPKSADDYYTLGIACMNARQFVLAVDHLTKADKLKPRQDYVHYALAVSHALGGKTDSALAHLEAAFALRPENRFHARRDEDFQGLAEDPRFRRLIYPAGS